LETGPIKHTVLTGFEYQGHWIQTTRMTAPLPNIANVFSPVIVEQSNAGLVYANNFSRDIESRQYGIYAQDQMELTEQWKVRVGGRGDCFDTSDFNRLNSIDREATSYKTNGQGGVVFQPIPETSFYGGASRGHQAILTTEAANTALPPENSTQFELGNKTLLLDGKLSINTALFTVTRKNFLVTIGPDTIPVGEQRTEGVDVDLQSEPIKGWICYANYSLQDAVLVSVPVAPAAASPNGHRPTGIPENSANLWTTYELQDGALKGFGFGGGITYKDNVFLDQLNTQGIPSYIVGDVVAFYKIDPVVVQLNVYNVADSLYFRNGVNSGALPGNPLAFQGTVRVNF
jgi:iron complex outermembrane receptor protein